MIEKGITPSNYADDNSCRVIGKTKDETLVLVKESISALVVWFKNNMMKANLDKFQFMFLCPKLRRIVGKTTI